MSFLSAVLFSRSLDSLFVELPAATAFYRDWGLALICSDGAARGVVSYRASVGREPVPVRLLFEQDETGLPELPLLFFELFPAFLLVLVKSIGDGSRCPDEKEECPREEFPAHELRLTESGNPDENNDPAQDDENELLVVIEPNTSRSGIRGYRVAVQINLVEALPVSTQPHSYG